MISPTYKFRPNCQEILLERFDWGLSIENLKMSLEHYKWNLTNEIVNIENCFHFFFIKKKMKHIQ
jgi:hypothetical protein